MMYRIRAENGQNLCQKDIRMKFKSKKDNFIFQDNFPCCETSDETERLYTAKDEKSEGKKCQYF